MKSAITKSLTVSLVIAAAIALPTAVKAQANNASEATLSAANGEEISTESSACYPVPGLGWRCW